MLTVAERRQRADAAIARAMRTLQDVQAAISAQPGDAGPVVPMRQVAFGDQLRTAVEAGVARAFGQNSEGDLHEMQKATAAGVSDATLRRALEVAAEVTGETDPAKLAAILEEALNVSVYDTDGALPLAKALEAPVDRRAFANVPGELEMQLRDRAAQLDLAKSAGAERPGDSTDGRYFREVAAVLPELRSMKPMKRERAQRPDNREELKALRDEALRQGNGGAAAMWNHELALAEVRHATGTPTATLAVRGAIPVAAA